jgi:Tol biopolymer transport system component
MANRGRCTSIWVWGVVLSVLLAGCAGLRPPRGKPPRTTTTSVLTTTTTAAPPSTTTTSVAPPTTTTTASSTTTTTSPIPEPGGAISRVTNGAGGPIGGDSWGSVISADGRYVAFGSSATDLVPDDTNFDDDIFVWDRLTSSTERITDGNDPSHSPAISADGGYVAFSSWASDLTPDDLNDKSDLFVWNATTGTTTRITDGNGDSYGATISADGRYIAFESAASNLVPGDTSDTNDKSDVFVWDATTATTTRVTDSANASFFPAMSADGRYITFYAFASNQVPDDTSGWWDVFVWDATTGTTTRITDGDENSLDPTISGDGRYITFWSAASNLVPNDTNGPGLFRWDATNGAIVRVSSGGEAPLISADGRYVIFNHAGDSFQDVFVWDATTATATNITHGNGRSYRGSVSANGGLITFSSEAFNLVPGDANGSVDVFLWDRHD